MEGDSDIWVLVGAVEVGFDGEGAFEAFSCLPEVAERLAQRGSLVKKCAERLAFEVLLSSE